MSTKSPFLVWLGRLLLVIGSPLLFLAIAELTIRVAGIETDVAQNRNAQIAVPVWLFTDQGWVRQRQADLMRSQEPIKAVDVAWMYHFEEARWIQYRMKPNVDTLAVNPFNRIEVAKNITFQLTSNSDGFRGHKLGPKRPRVTRIVTIGDSSTFGWGVELEHTFQHILEAKLNKSLPGSMEVINLGIPGQNTRHGVGMLRHYAMPLEPDLLIMSYGANDPRLVPTAADELLAAHDTYLGALRFVLLELRSYRLLRRLVFTVWDPLTVDPEEAAAAQQFVQAVPLKEYRNNLAAMWEIAEAAAVPTVFMSVCTGAEEYVAMMASVARDTKAPMLNTRALFADRLEELIDGRLHPRKVRHYRSIYGRRVLERMRQYYVTNDGCHPNWVGHSLIAEALAPLVKRALRRSQSATAEFKQRAP